MPDVLGLVLSAARSALEAADVGPYSWVYGCYGSPDINEVVRQSPGGGAQVPRTTHVSMYLQADNCVITVPDVLGLVLSAARSALEAADVGPYSWVYGCYGSPDINEVVRQSPGGGAQVPRTTHVSMYLQADNCVITVPDVLGLALSAARSALEAADVGPYSWVYGCYGSPDINEVVRQSPGGGAQVPRTTHVSMYLQADNC